MTQQKPFQNIGLAQEPSLARPMLQDVFTLSDALWAAIAPLLPRLGGKPRVDDRRVISGILQRYREGLRWRNCQSARKRDPAL